MWSGNHFQLSMSYDLWTPKWIGVILDSWRVCVLSFMKIGEKGKQLLSGNQFQLSMSCDLDLWTPKIDRGHPWHRCRDVALARCRDVAMSQSRAGRVVALSRWRVVAMSRWRVVALSHWRVGVVAMSRWRVGAKSLWRVVDNATSRQREMAQISHYTYKSP